MLGIKQAHLTILLKCFKNRSIIINNGKENLAMQKIILI
jgi:hypothetical protein